MNNQKKKVLLVITKSNFGGAQKYVFELAKGLVQKGFVVQVALGGEGILIQKLKEENIDVIQIPHLGRDISILNDIKTFFTLIKICIKNKPDIIHVNSSKIGAIGTLAARICFIPKIIFTIHGWAFNENRSVLAKQILKIIYTKTIFFSHTSIAVSDATLSQASSLPFFFLIKNKIKTVHNGIEIPNFLSKDESLAFLSSKINTDLQDKKIVGQIAELHPIKSIETTIEAAKYIVQKFPNTRFLIIGEGEERKKLEKLIHQNNLNQHVFLLGFIDNAAQYIKAFDVFCLTSKSEALALVLLEAGLGKIPVIASCVGGIPELITNGETGFLFEKQNVSELTNKIEHVLSLPSEDREKIIKQFHKKIQSNFLLEHMLEKTVNIYNS
jgi:glycosyltransferase involved in cell wall biosynthesis